MHHHHRTMKGPRRGGGPISSQPTDRQPLTSRPLRLRFGLGVFAAEPLDATCCIHQSLLAGEERVACRADFHVNVALVGRTGLKIVSAGAHHPHRGIIGMNLFFSLGIAKDRPFLQSFLLYGGIGQFRNSATAASHEWRRLISSRRSLNVHLAGGPLVTADHSKTDH